MSDLLERIKAWAQALKLDVLALWFAARSKETPVVAKMVAGLVAAYALSPVDLIPDFIPVIGYLDDLLLVPLGVALSIRLIPTDLMQTFRDRAKLWSAKPKSYAAATVVIAVWIGISLGISIWLWRYQA